MSDERLVTEIEHCMGPHGHGINELNIDYFESQVQGRLDAGTKDEVILGFAENLGLSN